MDAIGPSGKPAKQEACHSSQLLTRSRARFTTQHRVERHLEADVAQVAELRVQVACIDLLLADVVGQPLRARRKHAVRHLPSQIAIDVATTESGVGRTADAVEVVPRLVSGNRVECRAAWGAGVGVTSLAFTMTAPKPTPGKMNTCSRRSPESRTH